MLMLILGEVNLLRCRLNGKGFQPYLAFLVWGSTIIRFRTIHDICISINVFLFKSVSTRAPGSRATCHLTDFNENLPV